MTLEVTIDAATLREQITLLRGMLANPRISARQRYLITDLLRMLGHLESAADTNGADTRGDTTADDGPGARAEAAAPQA